MSEKSRNRRAVWRATLLVVAALAVVYGGFELGRSSAGYFAAAAMAERLEQERRNAALEAKNHDLRQRANVAEVGQRVDRQAQTEAQRMIGELQSETARQKQELQFYRGLVARQFGAGTLRVQELRVRAEDEERRYRVLITLVQAATRNTVANGTVTFSVEGEGEGEGEGEAPKALALADIELDQRRQFPFSLRFFQQIEVPIELPLDFRPARLHVEYRLGRNPEPYRQTFEWRVEGLADAPPL